MFTSPAIPEAAALSSDAIPTALQPSKCGYEALLCGRTLGGRYRIDAVLDRGGMGIVYRGFDLEEARTVAVKVAAATGGGRAAREAAVKRLSREGRAGALTKSSRAVAALASGVDPSTGLLFLVMEFLDGENLAVHLLGRRASVWEWLAFGDDASTALIGCHDAGVVHRDVKPSNLFVTADRTTGRRSVRLIDFGIAQLPTADGTLTHLTHAGPPPATPKYASPEQLRGESLLSPKTDVYSLALVLFEMLAGPLPGSRPPGGYSLPAPRVEIRDLGHVLRWFFTHALEPRAERRFDTRFLSSAIAVVGQVARTPFVEALAKHGYRASDDMGRSQWFNGPDDRLALSVEWEAEGIRLRAPLWRRTEAPDEEWLPHGVTQRSRVTQGVYASDGGYPPRNIWWLEGVYGSVFSGEIFETFLRAFLSEVRAAKRT